MLVATQIAKILVATSSTAKVQVVILHLPSGSNLYQYIEMTCIQLLLYSVCTILQQANGASRKRVGGGCKRKA